MAAMTTTALDLAESTADETGRRLEVGHWHCEKGGNHRRNRSYRPRVPQKLDFLRAEMEFSIEESAAPQTVVLSVGAGTSECSRGRAEDITTAIGSVRTLVEDIEAHVFDELLLRA